MASEQNTGNRDCCSVHNVHGQRVKGHGQGCTGQTQGKQTHVTQDITKGAGDVVNRLSSHQEPRRIRSLPAELNFSQGGSLVNRKMNRLHRQSHQRRADALSAKHFRQCFGHARYQMPRPPSPSTASPAQGSKGILLVPRFTQAVMVGWRPPDGQHQ